MRIDSYLKGIDYPGRIIASGLDGEGRLLLLYAITARSASSRSWVLRMRDGRLFTEPSGMEGGDRSLLIYSALERVDDGFVIANGDHSETISRFIGEGRSLEEAIASRTFEHDAPSYTPRIFALAGDDGSCRMGIIRRAEGDAERIICSYPPERGIVHLVHTYASNGDPLPSFCGLPARLEGAAADEVWASLASDLRVALYMKCGDDERIINAKEG